MDPLLRVVVSTPLKELWNSSGALESSRLRDLAESDIVSLLRLGLVQFVIADVGEPLHWVDPQDCYRFWKTELRPHLANSSKFYLDDFPGSYAYVASEWSSREPLPLVVLELHH